MNSQGKKKRHLMLTINGVTKEFLVAPTTTLLELVRGELGLTGAKRGCDDGNCGACTMLIDGAAVKTCIVLALQVQGRDVVTIEGVGSPQQLHPLQQAFLDHFASQCGYCTPGMILTAKALLDEHPNATEHEIRDALHGTICRCTGYVKIVEAIEAARDARV